jgi:hypothetical protein
MKRILVFIGITLFLISATQAQGYFSGDVQMNSDFYVRDTLIGAAGTPHYDNLKSSTDSWIGIRYTNEDWGLKTGIRIDLFHNSNLHNPGTPFNGYGLGNWFVTKDIKGVEITGGYFYDQFGSGITFRAYEDRALGIDNALLGARIKYAYKDKLVVKAFTGVQKNRFTFYKPVIKGINAEGYFQTGKVTLSPGICAVNRTIDQASMDQVAATIQNYDTSARFIPKYNTYVFSAYNTLSIGGFSWYVEGAYKTKEAIKGSDGATLINRAGNVLYTNLTFTKKNFGITGQYKRVENWQLRTSTNESLLQGMISFLPPTARQNSLRLLSRYNAASQELNESAFSVDMTTTPKKGYSIDVSISGIYNNALKVNYFREVYLGVDFKKNKNVKGMLGFQYIRYNQKFYTKDGAEKVDAYSPFGELSVKFHEKFSLRTEVQYQYCPNDYGHWLFALLEFNVAPHWSLAASDMWNVAPNKTRTDHITKPVHYYSFFSSYTYNQHRLTLAYVRQVSGIVCTGGVCRYEPAFSGVRLTFNTSF